MKAQHRERELAARANRASLFHHLYMRLGNVHDCWEWVGPLNRDGYGVFNFGARGRALAHRMSFQLHMGDIPDEYTLDHTCHNADPHCPGGICKHRKCCNPAHLKPVPAGDNSLSGKSPAARNARKDTCPNGHPYTHADKKGWRKCKICEQGAVAQRQPRDGRTKTAEAPGKPRRWTVECSRGHPWEPETTRWSKGKRYCKICDSINGKAKREREKEIA